MPLLEIEENQFIYDGKPLRILSGAIHYFRVPPEYWHDRLLKLKACGLNTVETYVPWNLHEPQEGTYDFSGIVDIEKFLQTARELGLFAIVRPGPYICAEWEFGGLPAWLLAKEKMELRCSNPAYLKRVDEYWDILIPRLKPFLSTQGGPIIALQVENEYGSYGNDTTYLQYLKEGLRRRGMDVLLFTSDGPSEGMLKGGTLPDLLKTVNYGSKARESFNLLRKHQPQGPLMCTEYWNGWFDHWGEAHHTRDAQDAAETLKEILDTGASFNLYMFHGGTNFGFLNGANQFEKYLPTLTSYDYDSPVSESGEPTPKYYAYREILSQYTQKPLPEIPPSIPKTAYGTIKLTHKACLFDNLDNLTHPVPHTTPLSMEKLGQNYGFILYRGQLNGPLAESPLVIRQLHDRGYVFLDGEFQGILTRNEPDMKILLTSSNPSPQLDILVENQGRVNYGDSLWDPKGIVGNVLLDSQAQFHWLHYPLPMETLDNLNWEQAMTASSCPVFYRGSLNVSRKTDTFLQLEGWTKGNVFINGINLGRYWNIGPQQTLYLPAPFLKEGDNEVIILELEKPADSLAINSIVHPMLG